MKFYLNPSAIRPVSTAAAILFALPLSWGIFSGFYAILSPFIMLNSVLLLKKITLLNSLAILILVISFFKKRFFCNYICPAGYLCDKVSHYSPFKPSVHKKMPDLSSVFMILSLFSAVAGLPLLIFFDPLSLFNGFFTVFRGIINPWEIMVFSAFPVLLALNFLLPGIWCSKICPLGGLQNFSYKVQSLFNRKINNTGRQSPDLSLIDRRNFIAAGAGLTAGIFIPDLLRPENEPVIRPPNSIEPGKFSLLCIRCGNCLKSCPTAIIIRNSDTRNLLTFMTPVIRFDEGYCLENCNNCGTVCPTGSIAYFSIRQKKEIIMGKAVLKLDDCLLLNNMECNRCKVSCGYDAVEYGYSEEMRSVIPSVKTSVCTGCGACKIICPAGCFEIIPDKKKYI